MNTLGFNRRAFSICATAAMLAGCSGRSQSIFNPAVTAQGGAQRSSVPHLAGGDQVVFSFDGSDGSFPEAGLTVLNGTFYGTTERGGVNRDGEVFSVTTSGQERVLHTFVGSDGARPNAGLTALHGTLYGTTSLGGPNRGGVVFSISASGTERVLYRFTRTSDGARPYAGLTALNGTLYGTTSEGGAYGEGTVFSITTSGQERVLHSFKGTSGANPVAGLTVLNGVLYGTASSGGPSGNGAIFSITTAGKERLLYSFQGGSDGEQPVASLTVVNGTLYGTTVSGGTGCGGVVSCGTVFSVTTSGTERVLYSFKSGSDGEWPRAGLTLLNGTLYGTTALGGGACPNDVCGTVFRITRSGHERVLYSFRGYPHDGETPDAGLIVVNGALYGTTVSGGAHDKGIVFEFPP